MNTNDVMHKLRQLDMKANQWFQRHSFLLFFPVILGCLAVFFVLTINVINIATDIPDPTHIEKLLLAQNESNLFVIFLILINSFWMVFLLASLFRIRTVLKNVEFNLSRRQADRRSEDQY